MNCEEEQMTEKKWYTIWNPAIPKVFEPEKPISEYLRDVAAAMPHKIAISFYGYDLTFEELDQGIDRFAIALIDMGVKKGDRVALFLQNCPQFIISYFGALRAGAIVVSLNPMFKKAELEYELNDCGAETIISLDSLYPEIRKISNFARLKHIIVTSLRDFLPEKTTLPLSPEMRLPKTDFSGTTDFLELLAKSRGQPICEINNLKEDIALLQYTGGTTGMPKGAIVTHHQLAHNIAIAPKWYGYESSDVFIGIVPFFHCQGMVQTMGAALVSGARLVILGRFSTESLFQAIQHYSGTVLKTNTSVVISMIEWRDASQYDLSGIRIVTYGGAVTPSEIAKALRKRVPNARMGEGYGLTESMSVAAFTPFHRPKEGTLGIPCISTDLKIVDLETGKKELEPNGEGEIIIRGPAVMKGYWNKPEESKETLRNGWLYTGDIGRMDEEGYVTLVGRKKEMMKCSGFSVFPAEVEDLLYRHPAIAAAGVIGIPDPYRGESPKAFIVLKPEYRGKITQEQILEWAKENMATYKRPREVEFREELPVSSAGKILKRILAKEEEDKRRV
jgi:acyl-CoA synthetase (AMP-forming)/AMP-acid ligase II